MYMNLSQLQETVKDRRTWCVVVHGVAKSWTGLAAEQHGLQPNRLLRPWDFPSKSTGVGCHCLLQLEEMDQDNWFCFAQSYGRIEETLVVG